MRARERMWPRALLGWSVLTLLAVAGSLPLRAPIVTVYLLVAPGMGFVPILGVREWWAELTLAIALSVSLDIIVSGTLLYAHAWSVTASVMILVLLTVAGALAQIALSRVTVPSEPLP